MLYTLNIDVTNKLQITKNWPLSIRAETRPIVWVQPSSKTSFTSYNYLFRAQVINELYSSISGQMDPIYCQLKL